MLIASELLDLLDVCYLSIDELGGLAGIEEIKRVLEIKDDEELEELLTFIDGQWIVDDACDGFFEDLYKRGFGTNHYDKLFELNLISYKSGPYQPSEDELYPPEEIGFFRLTALGKEVLEAIMKKRLNPPRRVSGPSPNGQAGHDDWHYHLTHHWRQDSGEHGRTRPVGPTATTRRCSPTTGAERLIQWQEKGAAG